MITNTKMASLWKKLREKKFRDAFVASQFKRSIPFQITALREKLDWSQEQLADAAKVTQGVISRAENPNYGNLTFNTVLRVANGLDVGVIIEFVPFSKLLETFEDRSEDQAPVQFKGEDRVVAPEVERLLMEQATGAIEQTDSCDINPGTAGEKKDVEGLVPQPTRDTRPNPLHNRSSGVENFTENQREEEQNKPFNPFRPTQIGMAT